MRKRIWPALLLAAALLSLCGCGQKNEPVEMALSVNGTKISGDTEVEVILDLLGDDYQYYEAISSVYEGMDKTYSYGDCVLYTYPDGETDRLMELYCTGGDVSAKGITFGAAREEIVETFGGDFREEGAMLLYEAEPASANNTPASLYFELNDGVVSAIAVTAEHRSQ